MNGSSFMEQALHGPQGLWWEARAKAGFLNPEDDISRLTMCICHAPCTTDHSKIKS